MLRLKVKILIKIIKDQIKNPNYYPSLINNNSKGTLLLLNIDNNKYKSLKKLRNMLNFYNNLGTSLCLPVIRVNIIKIKKYISIS